MQDFLPRFRLTRVIQIHLVTGKGGVGKSVLALALAKSFAAQGKKTLLAELGELSFFASALDRKVHFSPELLLPGLDIAIWDAKNLLSEYILHLIKIPSLHKLFFENDLTQALIDAAPSLKELAILGKITSGPPRNVGPKLDYDVIVIDAFASGHFLALMKAPLAMAETFKRGPMREQSLAIMEVLKNPKLATYHLVFLPEELSIEEGLELQENLGSIVQKQQTRLWLNQLIPNPRDLIDVLDSPQGVAWQAKYQQQIQIAQKLRESGSFLYELPWIPSLNLEEITDFLKPYITPSELSGEKSYFIRI